MQKLILHCRLSPGDIVVLTAAVEALSIQHPGRFLIDVRTSCPALWEGNPYLTPLSDDDPEVRHIECEYPLIHQSNQRPYHFIHGYVRHLSEQLNLPLEPVAFRGDIHLQANELTFPVLLTEFFDEEEPYWIVCAGGKYDYTIKWWHRRRWQQVVDHFQGRMRFVQVGEKGHFHPPLENVIDLRGRTSLRELVHLVHRAAGILSPVTLLMHLAAAVPVPVGQGLRPCVVVAGGREPAHWEAYPGHQFLHTVGLLPCCARGGCWRARTVPLNDQSEQNDPARLCLSPQASGLPECMDLITAEHVIQALNWAMPRKPKASPASISHSATLTTQLTH